MKNINVKEKANNRTFEVSAVIVSIIFSIVLFIFMITELAARNYFSAWRDTSVILISTVSWFIVSLYLISELQDILSTQKRATRYIILLCLFFVSSFIFTSYHTVLFAPLLFGMLKMLKQSLKENKIED